MDNNNVPNMPNSDAVAARRRALAEALRSGEPVVVTEAAKWKRRKMLRIRACPVFRFQMAS